MVLIGPWSWGSHRFPAPTPWLVLAWASAGTSLLQEWVQKWFVLEREANVLGILTLPGQATYNQEEKDASDRASEAPAE